MKLKCAACGTETWTDHPAPQMGMDLMQACADVRWAYAIQGPRLVVFCSRECLDANITKRQRLRRSLRNPWSDKPPAIEPR